MVVAFVAAVAALVEVARFSDRCFAAKPFRDTATTSNSERVCLWRLTHNDWKVNEFRTLCHKRLTNFALFTRLIDLDSAL